MTKQFKPTHNIITRDGSTIPVIAVPQDGTNTWYLLYRQFDDNEAGYSWGASGNVYIESGVEFPVLMRDAKVERIIR